MFFHEYAEMEYDFIEEFERIYLDNMIMFVSEESLTKVTNPILEVGYDNPVRYEDNKKEVFNIPLDCWFKGESYVLAA
ncbi:hypothetical protein M067_4956 [Bacteroides fragilis str. J-143-4]|nr:hypothetical protein M067_4956 [Bacteroides fragilis str. J-143-4]